MSSPVVLVIGASGDLGCHLSLHLAEHGARVLGTYRGHPERLQQAAEAATSTAGEIVAAQADITSLDSMQSVVGQTLERFGQLDALVVMSGRTQDNLLHFMTEEEFDSIVEINLKGAFLACKAAASPMMMQRRGRIILVSSLSATRGVLGQVNYGAAKAGLLGLCRGLLRELSRFNILTNVVAPGLIESAVNEQMETGQRETLLAGVALQRVGQPEEISAVIRFLALDPGATYITGQILSVDGGVT